MNLKDKLVDENIEPCLYLPWDSDFFNRRIARAQSSYLDPIGYTSVSAWCELNDIDCVYFLSGLPNSISKVFLLENGFIEVGKKATFNFDIIDSKNYVADEEIGIFKEEEVNDLKTIASAIYRDTRFYNDPNFNNKRCDEFYEVWIENSCRGYADNVFVSRKEGNTAGFVTCHKRDGYGDIGLLGVKKDQRGRGVGKALLGAAVNYFTEQGFSDIRAVTQSNNIGAVKLYESSNFSLFKTEEWFHKWFDRD